MLHTVALFDTVEQALALTDWVYEAMPKRVNDPDTFGDQPVVTARGFHFLRAVPALVEGRPGDDRRVVAVAHDYFFPLGEEVARTQLAVGVGAPAGGFGPGEVAKAVGPVVEAFLEHLLVQAGAVEAHGQRALDVGLEGGVARGGPDAVGVETLVQDQAQEQGLVV